MNTFDRLFSTILVILVLAGGAGLSRTASAEAAALKTAKGSSVPSAAAVTEKPLKENESPEQGFSYVHDPRLNRKAMEDILENPDAVYGFSPDPDSARRGTFAEYDWTDPDVVETARKLRVEYHESMESMTDILYRMRDEGASIEEMARAISAERNRIRLASSADDPEALEKVKKSNLKTYGHEEGPTPDELFEKYSSWTGVIQGAFSTNMGMDACCGLYDEYYPLYIELGLAEP